MGSKGTWLEREMIESIAFRQLSGTAVRVLLLFRLKQRKERRRVAGRKSIWVTTNNGELVFTYKEAKSRFGIKQGAFRDALDSLISRGFLDIAETGAGLFKSATLYSISERWRDFAGDKFKAARRKRDTRRLGFQGRHST